MWNFSIFFKELEYRKDFPRTFFYFYSLSIMENARDIFIKATSGDVSDSVNIDVAYYIEHRLYVDAGGCQKHFTKSLVACLPILLVKFKTCVSHNLAYE